MDSYVGPTIPVTEAQKKKIGICGGNMADPGAKMPYTYEGEKVDEPIVDLQTYEGKA